MSYKDTQITIKFFKSKDDAEPTDVYPIDWRDRGAGFASHNWLEMHPDGKVQIEPYCCCDACDCWGQGACEDEFDPEDI